MSINADFIFYGGDIITMDESCPSAEALAVKRDKIVSVGKLEDVLKMKGDATKVIYLNKQTLMPGLIEPHQHVSFMATFRVRCVDISGYYYKTYAEIKEVIVKAINELQSPQSWVIFNGWDTELIPNMPTLSAEFIAKTFSSEHPILIIAQNMHVAWANMKAFEMAGIPEDVPNPEFGSYVRDANGKLTGQVYEMIPLMRLFNSAPQGDGDTLLTAMQEQWREYAKAGITTTTDMLYIQNKEIDDLIVRESRKDNCPIRLAIYWDVDHISAKTRFFSSSDDDGNGKNEFLWDAGVKIIADGSPHAGNMAVREPYLKSNLTDILGFPSAPCYGNLNYSTEVLLEMVRAQHLAGKQIAIHAHGERACDQVLAVYEQVLSEDENPLPDRRHRMEHLGLMTEEQIERAGKLNLALSFFVNHLYFYGKTFDRYIFGSERTKRWAPCSLGTKYGLRWTLHQDQPAHPGPPRPFASIKTAVTRTDRTDPDTVYGPEYCVDIHQALKAYTTNAAWQLHMEDKIGSLTVGKQADLVILSDNPYNVDPMDLGSIEVMETFVAGRRNNLCCLKDQQFLGAGVKMMERKPQCS